MNNVEASKKLHVLEKVSRRSSQKLFESCSNSIICHVISRTFRNIPKFLN